jgi:ubiquinol-cytochrome c reductase cytochrome c subunit
MAFLNLKGKLSRRKPMAAAVVIAAGLLISGGGYAAASTAMHNTQSATVASAAQIDEGHKLFLSNCASCHGAHAEGTKNAPTLIGVGAAAVDFQVSSGRMPAQASGPQIEAKDQVSFTDSQIAALAAYVGSLGPGPAIPTDAMVANNGNETRGGELFRTNCAMCHNAAGAGGALTQGKYGPALTDTSAREMYEAMETGPQNMPVFNDANLTPKDKKDIITYLVYLQQHPSPAGLNLDNLGPVAEGLFVWIFVLGGIIGITVWLGAKSN